MKPKNKTPWNILITAVFAAVFVFVAFLALPQPAHALSPINTCLDLQNMSSGLAISYFLGNDIDCSATAISDPLNPKYDNNLYHDGAGFIPVGTWGTPFIGSLEGNDHIIENLTIARPSEDYVGLFGWVGSGTFQNFNITGSIEGNGYVGALAGEMNGAVTVDLVSSSAVITAHDDSYVGGLIGDAQSPVTLTNSSASGNITITSGSSIGYIGGLVGRIGNNNSTIASSSATGNLVLTSTGDTVNYVGGLIGIFAGASIATSSASGNITTSANGSSDYIGGLVGFSYNSSGQIVNSSASGNVLLTSTGSSVDYIGGLVGMFTGTSISSSISSSDLTLNAPNSWVMYFGGLVGEFYNSSGQIVNSSASGNITSTSGSVIYYGGGLSGDFGGNISSSTSSGNMTLNAEGGNVGYVGGLAGLAGRLTITDSSATGNMIITTGSQVDGGIGGLIGQTGVGYTINESYSTGDIVVTAAEFVFLDNGVGGLVGYSGDYLGGDNDSITNSFSASDITVNSGADVWSVGGLLGFVSAGTLTVSSSYAAGNIRIVASSSIDSVGGLIGSIAVPGAAINDTFSAGLVSVNSDTHVTNHIGGFIGNYDAATVFSNNYFDKTRSTQNLCTGQDGSDPTWCTAETDSNIFKGNHNAPIFSNWNFDTIWSFVCLEYPILHGVSSSCITTGAVTVNDGAVTVNDGAVTQLPSTGSHFEKKTNPWNIVILADVLMLILTSVVVVLKKLKI